MSTTIYGTPVGTPLSPEKIAELLRMVKTVNGQGPDENGNVTIDVGSVDAEQLNEAVRAALQAAKESGAFDGKTPVKGEDYFTEADKAELVNSTLSALPTWEGGSY